MNSAATTIPKQRPDHERHRGASQQPPGKKPELRWVPIQAMTYQPGICQRSSIDWTFVAQIAADFDLDKVGHPTVSRHGDHMQVLDGMHRVEALKQIGWGDQKIECWTHTGLNEAAEADLFLGLNTRRAVTALDRYRAALTAGRPTETHIDAIVTDAGLSVAAGRGGIKAVGALRTVYDRHGPDILARALTIVRDAYGPAGMEKAMITGIGQLVARYRTDLDDADLAARLQQAAGGLTGLLSSAEQLRLKTRRTRAHCVAAAAVETHNRQPGGRKLPNWWRHE